jgi:hypothetical protein
MSRDMEINYSKYDYTRWGTPDTLLHRWEKDQAPVPVHMHSFLESLLKRLQLYHANWTLVTRHGWGTYGGPGVKAIVIDVYENQEWLGTIDIGHQRGDRCFEITGPRVEAALRYGRHKKTSDEKKAYKLIKEYFTPRNSSEAARVFRNQATNVAGNAAYKTRRDLEQVTARVERALTTYMLDNFDVVSRALVAYGVPLDTSKQMPELFANNRITQDVSARLGGRTAVDCGRLVAKHNGRYIVMDPNDPEDNKTVPESELTSDQKQKIAMLKVFDREGEALEDVGMKVGADLYYLLP